MKTANSKRAKPTARSRLAPLAVASLVLMGVGATAYPAPAQAAIVLNRFERSCYWTCSSFRQTNGVYVPSIGSACVTKTWWGRTSTYYNPPYRPC